MAASELAPPVVTDAARRALAPAAPLPAALIPVDRRRLAGRWVPTDGHKAAYVEFTADGEWRGSDGCNDGSGRWITAAGGTLLATAGAVTLMYCAASVPVGAWLWTARRAGFEGATRGGRSGTLCGRRLPVSAQALHAVASAIRSGSAAVSRCERRPGSAWRGVPCPRVR
ncbi:META domain-containing protein [Micromonospora rubida]|uniref:META domain-containing protein n=1 Tax=Micromonospora rubida TaxID=2697657 RepID=A0ABW7SGS5_9ACTN